MRRTRNQRGAVTAEAAIVLPLVAILTVVLAWGLSLGVTYIRAVDAAREAARVAARGDGDGKALALGRRVATDGAQVRLARRSGTVVATVVAPIEGPGGIFDLLPVESIRASAVAAQEPTS